jgi:hypothetical protein
MIVCSANGMVKQKAALLGIDGCFEIRGAFDELLDRVARYCLTA